MHISFLTRFLITGSSPSNVSSKNIYFALVDNASIIAACLFIPLEKLPIGFAGFNSKSSVSLLNLSQSNFSYIDAYSFAILFIFAPGRKNNSSATRTTFSLILGFSYIGASSIYASPFSGLYIPARTLKNVDFPAPLEPTIPYIQPSLMLQVILSSATKSSKFLLTSLTLIIASPPLFILFLHIPY